MRIRSASDVVYTTIGWLPLIALAVGVMYVMGLGLFQLESISFGTEFLIGNDATSNLPAQIGGPNNEQLLMNAVAGGDVDQMSAALDAYEQRQAVRAAR